MAVTFNAGGDFSILNGNPNGVWTYQTNGVPYTFSGTATGYDFWAVDGTPGAAAVLFNTTASPVDIGTITLPPGELGLDPETDTDSTVRFTAPVRGVYAVTGMFVGIDNFQASHVVDIAASAGIAFQSVIDTYNQSAPFTFALVLNAGDTLDFVNNGNGIGNTATSLAATVTQAKTYKWRTGASGDFGAAPNWRPVGVPDVSDNAVIDVSGTYTVTSSIDRFLTRLGITNANATLAVTAGTFSTEWLLNDGSIVVGDGTADATLALEGEADNSGTLTFDGEPGAAATLSIGAAGVTLMGGGSVVLGGASGGLVTALGNGVLTNIDNVISGAGELGDGVLQLVNGSAGVIEAQGALHVSTASPIVNGGTLRAAAGGTLAIASDVVSRTGSVFEATGAGARVVFDNIDLFGRTNLQASAGGSFAVGVGLTVIEGNVTIDGDLAIDAAGNGADSALMFEGTVTNGGTLTVTGGASESAQLQVCDATVRLTGGGSVVLAGVADNSGIVGTTPRSRLINVDNTIEGAGYIGQGFFGDPLRLTNETGGTIDANVNGGTLLVDVPGLVTNGGTMQATNGGILALRGEIQALSGSFFFATGGDILLDNVDLFGEVIMQADLGGAIVVAPGLASLEGDISLSGSVTVDAVANGDYTELMLEGDVGNSDTIAITSSDDPSGPFATLSICDGPVTLLAGGSVVLSGETAAIFSTSFRSALTNVDNRIEGEGLVGDGLMPIVNQFGGLIDANVDGRTLWFSAGFDSQNAGTMQASNGGTLDVQGTIDFDVTGVLKTIGATSSVVLDQAGLRNATLDSTGGGAIVTAAGVALLDGNTSISGALELDAEANAADTAIVLSGVVTNQGVVTLVGGVDGSDPSIAYSAELLVDNVTFQGGGSVVLSGNAEAAIITGTTASTRLFNVDNTIAGAGLLGDQSLFLVNQDAGVIDADVSGKTLLVDTGANAIINRGTFGASNGGTLVVASPVRRAGLGVIDGGTLEFQSSVDAAVSFSANGGSLVLDNSTTFRGSVAGLGDNDLSAIDFMDIGFASVSASFSENGTLTGGTLRLRDGVDVARVMLLGDFASNFSVAPPPGYVGFVLADDQTANHGTLVSYLGP